MRPGRLDDLREADHRDDVVGADGAAVDLLARAVTEADRDPDHLAALVLAGLVAEPDRRRLATALELVDEDRRVEVEDVDPAAHGVASVSDTAGARPARVTYGPS